MPPPSNAFPLDPTHPIIPVDVLLEGPRGRQFVRMALDTGATLTTAPSSALTAIGCNFRSAKRHIEFIAAGSIEQKPLVRLKAISALGIRLRNLDVICHDLPHQSPIRGLLGLNFLARVSLHLDFPHRILTATKPHR